VDPSSHDTNPSGVFDEEAVPLPDLGDAKIEEGIKAVRSFVAEQ